MWYFATEPKISSSSCSRSKAEEGRITWRKNKRNVVTKWHDNRDVLTAHAVDVSHWTTHGQPKGQSSRWTNPQTWLRSQLQSEHVWNQSCSLTIARFAKLSGGVRKLFYISWTWQWQMHIRQARWNTSTSVVQDAGNPRTGDQPRSWLDDYGWHRYNTG